MPTVGGIETPDEDFEIPEDALFPEGDYNFTGGDYNLTGGDFSEYNFTDGDVPPGFPMPDSGNGDDFPPYPPYPPGEEETHTGPSGPSLEEIEYVKKAIKLLMKAKQCDDDCQEALKADNYDNPEAAGVSPWRPLEAGR